jgi:hypothetical protein
MGRDETDQEYADADPMAGAVEHDATHDGYTELADEVDHALGLDRSSSETEDQEYVSADPLAGAVEHDATHDGYTELADQVDHALGLDRKDQPAPDPEAGDGTTS